MLTNPRALAKCRIYTLSDVNARFLCTLFLIHRRRVLRRRFSRDYHHPRCRHRRYHPTRARRTPNSPSSFSSPRRYHRRQHLLSLLPPRPRSQPALPSPSSSLVSLASSLSLRFLRFPLSTSSPRDLNSSALAGQPLSTRRRRRSRRSRHPHLSVLSTRRLSETRRTLSRLSLQSRERAFGPRSFGYLPAMMMVSSLVLSLSCWNPQSHLRVKSRVFSSSESSSSSSSSQKTNNTAQTRFGSGARGRSCTNDTSPFFLSALRVMQKQTYLTFPKCVLFKRTHAESREPLPSLSLACTHSLFSLAVFSRWDVSVFARIARVVLVMWFSYLLFEDSCLVSLEKNANFYF